MTIILTKPVRVGGVELAAATTQSIGAALEADLVARGCATYKTNPMLGGQVPVMADYNPITGASAVPGFDKTAWSSMVSSLENGQDELLIVIGDSTGDYTDEWVYLLTQRIAAKLPSGARLVYRTLDETVMNYRLPVVISAGTEPYVEVKSDARGWGVSSTNAGTELLELDLRVDVALDDWSSSATQSSLISRSSDGAGRTCWRLYLDYGGTPKLEWSEDGTTKKVATHPTAYAWGSFPAASRRWLRATLKCDNGASGHEVKFYTSADGITWTQSGTTVTGAGVTSIFTYATQPIEIGSVGADAGNVVAGNVNKPGKGKYYAAYASTAIDGGNRVPYFIRDCNQYPEMTGLRVGEGQLVVLNACVAGASTAWHGDSARAPKTIPVATAAKIIVCLTHNDCQSFNPKAYQVKLATLLGYATARIDLPEIILASANPRYSPATQQTIYTQRHICNLLQKICRKNGWQYVDIFSAYGSDASLVKADGVHPEPAGSKVATECVSFSIGLGP